jgi:hypothetical protein
LESHDDLSPLPSDEHLAGPLVVNSDAHSPYPFWVPETCLEYEEQEWSWDDDGYQQRTPLPHHYNPVLVDMEDSCGTFHTDCISERMLAAAVPLPEAKPESRTTL